MYHHIICSVKEDSFSISYELDSKIETEHFLGFVIIIMDPYIIISVVTQIEKDRRSLFVLCPGPPGK